MGGGSADNKPKINKTLLSKKDGEKEGKSSQGRRAYKGNGKDLSTGGGD